MVNTAATCLQKNFKKEVDDDVPASLFSCETCEQQFSTQALLETHRQREHPQGPMGKYRCTYCPYSSDYSTHVTMHERTHTGERPFVCKICKKRFNQSSALNRHLLVHAGTEPCECADCGVRFSDSSHLACHRKRHLGGSEASYVCPHCRSKFFTPMELNSHLLTHTEARPHACSQCGKRFRESGHARRHERMVHNRRHLLHRPQRGKGTSHVVNLRSHISMLHGSKVPEGKPPDIDE